MAKAKPYYADKSLSAAFYDVVAAADRFIGGDVDIYAGLAPQGADILELGAGTGRLTQALAERGHAVTGVDIAPAMLTQAEARKAALPPEVAGRMAFQRGDMTSLALGRTFGLVVCPFFTLAHVPAGAAWKNTFAVAAKHMAPGALAAFHLPYKAIMGAQTAKPNGDVPVLSEPVPGGGRLMLYVRERAYKEAYGRLEQVIEYVELSPAGQPVRRSEERLVYYVADPAPLAQAAGLVLDRPAVDLGGIGEICIFRRA